jgi:hypothetical protein
MITKFSKKVFVLAVSVMTVTVMHIHGMEQKGPPDWQQEVKQIRQLTQAFRTGITVEATVKGEMLKTLSAGVDDRVAALRKKLNEEYGNVPDGVSVLKYLPAEPILDGSVDYRPAIQKALNENVCVVLTGNNDPAKPNIYGLSCGSDFRGIIIPEGKVLVGSPGAILRRMPSVGALVVLGKEAQVIGVTIDGNKKSHNTPELLDKVGKTGGTAFQANGDRAVIRNCVVFDAPGHAFHASASNVLLWRCKARNCGIIDLKFNADYYQGKWDSWSGDAFYIKGFHDLIMDCESYDCFRWGFTTCHDKAGASTYIDCLMYNEKWRTYGFIDIEDCRDDREGTILVGMKAPKGKTRRVVVSSEKAVVLNCTMERFIGRSADDLIVAGCTTYGSGLGVGGWSSTANAMIRGGTNPVILDNTVIKNAPKSGIPEVSDWSLSVFSTDGKGIVAGNILKEYEGQAGKGMGMKLDKVSEANNEVEYGQWTLEPSINLSVSAQDEPTQQKLREFVSGVPDLASKLGIQGTITQIVMLQPQAMFLKDPDNVGQKQGWFDSAKRPAANKLTCITLGDSWQSRIGDYRGQAWCFTTFKVSGDDFHACDTANLLFGGASAECQVYLNGKLVGGNKNGDTPFNLNIPVSNGTVRWDDTETNDVAIRIFLPGTMSGIFEYVALVLSKNLGEAPAVPVSSK